MRAVVDEVVDRLDLAAAERAWRADGLALNDIGRVRVRVSQPAARPSPTPPTA